MPLPPKPYKPAQKPKRLPERKAMTIGVGLLCSDGVEISSDMEITSGQSSKYKQRKTCASFKNGNAFIMTYAAPNASIAPSVYRGLRDDLFNRMDKSKEKSGVDRALDALSRLLKGSDKKHLQMLIGITYKQCQPFLIETYGSHVDDKYELSVIGFGDSSVTRYIQSFIIPDNEPLTLEKARILGAYVVDVASRYVQFVGSGRSSISLKRGGLIGIGDGDIFPGQAIKFQQTEKKVGEFLRSMLFSETSSGV
jgi:hypothetical protein